MYESNKNQKKPVTKNEDGRDFKTNPITRVENTKKCQILLNGLRVLNVRYFATIGPEKARGKIQDVRENTVCHLDHKISDA